ncbi:MAG: radical SAM protein [Magnetospirillum sp. WYHS-4]
MGDLAHATVGRHSGYMPLALGLLASYAQDRIGADNVTFSLHNDPLDVLALLDTETPEVLALTNYCWNAELSRTVFTLARERNPRMIAITGGPEFPTEAGEQHAYLLSRPEVDFYVFNEGEVAFASLLKALHEGTDRRELQRNPPPGVAAIDPGSGSLRIAPAPPRLQNLDVIPSPYLSGMMDKFFDGTHKPFIESARGCPYACTYCTAGEKWYSKVAEFSIERIKRELDYIAARMKGAKDIPLAIADSNFGMLKRDEEIAIHIRDLQDRFGWPQAFSVSTGKSQFERLLRVAEILQKRIDISISPQSLNPDTTRAIQRVNLGDREGMDKIYVELRKRGIKTYADMIVPLPEETKETFFEGIRKLCRSNVQRSQPFTTMLLKGTELAAAATREKYGMITKFRLLPRQFGTYRERRCFEIEEVCVGTNSMPFEDYRDCRGFSFIFSLYAHTQFDVFDRHLTEWGVERFDFIHWIWQQTNEALTPLADLYRTYLTESVGELFDSPEELRAFFSRDENYEKLLRGEIGDNLMRKYRTLALIEKGFEAIDLGYRALVALLERRPGGLDDRTRAQVEDARVWACCVRDFSRIVKLEEEAFAPRSLDLGYDLEGWYRAGTEGQNLDSFERPTSYVLNINGQRLRDWVKAGQGLFGGDIALWFPRHLESSGSIRSLWRTCRDREEAGTLPSGRQNP